MTTATEIERPRPRPFMSAASRFSAGDDTPRRFLERCLEAFDRWEPQIGAFVHVNIARARQSADSSSERWRAGRPLSPIDGMPVGIKDIIETADLPTEMGSPLFMGWRSERDAASVSALREAGAVILGKTVTTEFAASEPRGTRNPWDLRRTPGGSSSGSAAGVAVGMVSAALGTQVIGSIVRPASYCGCVGFKPTVGALNRGGSHDFLSQSCAGVLATTLEDAWQVAYEISSRVGGDPGFPGLFGPDRAPAAAKPRRLAVLETSGWTVASDDARQALDDVLSRLSGAGIAILNRRNESKVAELEGAVAEARALSASINEWESRWPLNTYRERGEEKLSAAMLGRLTRAESMRLDDYRAMLKRRNAARRLYADLAAVCDGCVTLSAPRAAPIGLESTGDPAFAVPASLLGIPAVSLPLLQDEGLPLGLQIMGFEHGDEAMFGLARWVVGTIAPEAHAA